MKIFEHFNQENQPCPICQKHTDGQAVLIPIDGTANDGICEAMQVHLDCISLRWKREQGHIIYQVVPQKGG